ncbi:testis-specific serine/threonine-protein kinase 1-like isoform X3 [Dermacentor albipictus]|uniref:testis-specific serine/threonine-protein kinase 1-like isoform X3 n=1 Tax=Dermacentor albipictus TaxID=60249 RepID=UPI0031FE0480
MAQLQSQIMLVSKGGTSYACKIVSKELTSAVYRAKFLPRELKILAAIRHSHITYVSEIIDLPSKVFIIMELATGGDLLDKILKVKRFKEKRAYKYFMQMASALAYLHYKDIAHRDLKCENILFTSTNRVKLADFSFARYCTGAGGNPKELSTTFCGSEAYAPPEVLQGIRYRPKKADVWSLGVILFVMVTGLLPYESECVPRQVRLQMTRTLRFPQVLPLSYQLKNLIRGMLEPVATLRSSMARVFRHPWVQMFPTAMAEVEARARHVAEARRVKQASPLKLMPRQHTGRAMHDEEELTGTSERGSKNASAIDQLEQRAAGTTGTSTSTTSSKTKKSTGREQRAGGTTGTSTSTTSSKTKKSTGRRASIASVHTAGSQQSTTSQDTSLENREPGRQKAKEDIAIKDIDIKNADRDDSPGKPADNLAPEAEPSNKDDAETSATSATSRQSGLAPSVSHGSEAPGSNISEDKLEDTSGGSTLADSVEDDLSSILRDVYSSGGEASSVADRCTCKGLDNEELDSHYEGCPCASKNGKPAMIIKPLPMPPKDFKPKGIMKL